MKVVFMGTADFAVPSLAAILKEGYEVVGVVTAPDKKAGRGQKISQSPVKTFAVENELNLLQPTNLKSEEFQAELKSLEADLFAVVAFRMLPESVWGMPPKGTINLHSSLLPQYRGAAPINWAIINGDKETGVSTFFIEKEIDTGDVIYQASTEIDPNENAGSLHDRLMMIGADLMVKTLSSIEKDDMPRVKQNFSQELLPAPKIFKDDCIIDWNKDVEAIHNFVRGMSPYPVAWTYLGDKSLRITEAEKELADHNHPSGSIHFDSKKSLKVACKGGYLNIKHLQLQGKKRMDIASFRNGTQLEEGTVLGN